MEDLKNRLIKMHKHFSKWARRRDIYAYRVYDRDLPDYPFAVDIYEDRLCISEYVNDSVTSRKNYVQWRDQVISTIGKALGFMPDKIYTRTRQRQKGNAQYDKISQRSELFEVREGGLKFLVNLSDYLDTGLFLDHRPTRSIIREEAIYKNFLNLFCYTGAFTVYAAAGKAQSTVSVDTSAVYLDWLQINLEINGLLSGQHKTVQADAREYVNSYSGKPFDLIFCDPPVFSTGKKLARDFDVLRDHPELIDSCLKILSPGGTLYFSTNFRKFRIQWQGKYEDISLKSIPDDFRHGTGNKQIHVCYRIKKPT
ncbi:MAG: class I SAM-dependent methyltransferase [Spirochaetia bacterium]|nr:class I SAM-dependent methyltransferase [Spirochaetia bacterium]